MAAPIRIGTCSWADEALTKHWYPKSVKSAEERLRYYAEHFSTVEVDSTYYRLPDESMVARWAERTPEDFVMHVKAFGLMTRHPVKAEQLPTDLREAAPVDDRGRVERPPREFRAEIFARFHRALEPLRASGKLGGVLLQFPSYVVYKDLSLDYLRWAVEQLAGDRALVEFRHRSWFDDENRAQTLAFLEELGAAHVIVDAPKTEARNLVPTIVGATSAVAYVRMHGRNAKTWNVRGGSASDRFDYLYSAEELSEWVEPLREVGEAAEQAYVLFNNNRWSRRDGGEVAAQAPANAVALRRILDEQGIPTG
ncbi:MAG TPA: DUF72 domain-containing protein [Gaiellaceae bacterium]|nr:DUF72 domain-containing protein [Gaiellaceae bacterium]